MKSVFGEIVFLWIVCLPALPQTETSVLNKGVLSNAELGLRYTPPGNMFDETDSARESIRSRAAALHTSSVFDVLLSLGFGDDTERECFSFAVKTFPRSNISLTSPFPPKPKLN